MRCRAPRSNARETTRPKFGTMLADSQMQHRIRAVSGPASGSVFTLGQLTTIGRGGETDIQVLGEGISREHAYIVKDDRQRMVLVDMSSKNGTFVEGQAIKRRDLACGDRFTIGDSEFVYEQEVEELDTADMFDLKLLSGPAVEVTKIGRPPTK